MPREPRNAPPIAELKDLARRIHKGTGSAVEKEIRDKLLEVRDKGLHIDTAMGHMRRVIKYVLEQDDLVISAPLRDDLKDWAISYGLTVQKIERKTSREWFSCTPSDSKAIEDAARRAGYKSKSEYVRNRLMAIVQEELGEK